MRGPSALLLVLATSALAVAAPPEVPKEKAVKPGQLIRVIVKTDKEIGLARNFTDEQAFFEELAPKKGERRYVFQCPDDAKPGAAFVVSWWTAGELEGVCTTFTVAGQPAPPVPPPVPPTPPVPVTQGTWAVMIVNESAPDPKAVMVTDGPTARQLKTAGKCRLYGSVSDAEKLKAKNYDAAMADAKVGPSCVLVFDDAGKVVTAFPLPATDADLAAKLKGVLK
jgi:hypothetical protein